MSDFKSIASSMEKFDGTNWSIWSFFMQANLMLMDAWSIADGTETRPPDLVLTVTPTPTAEQITARVTEQSSWDRRDRHGKSLIVLVIRPQIFQSISLTANLCTNWVALSGLPASKLSGNSDPRVQFYIQVAGARSIACQQTFWKQRSPCPISHPSCWRAIYCLQANFPETAIPVSNFRSKLLARDLLPASKLSGNSDPRVQF